MSPKQKHNQHQQFNFPESKMRPMKLQNSFCGALPDILFQKKFRQYEGWKFFGTLDGGKGGWKKAAGWLPAPG